MTHYHLRHIGPVASRPESAHIICFRRACTSIGRNALQVDHVLNSANYQQNAVISRRHARVIRGQDGTCRLFDDSRNGIFVNDVKINTQGAVRLSEGDTVTFGHKNGERVPVGARARQPNSEFQFIFEVCDCRQVGADPAASDAAPFQVPYGVPPRSPCRGPSIAPSTVFSPTSHHMAPSYGTCRQAEPSVHHQPHLTGGGFGSVGIELQASPRRAPLQDLNHLKNQSPSVKQPAHVKKEEASERSHPRVADIDGGVVEDLSVPSIQESPSISNSAEVIDLSMTKVKVECVEPVDLSPTKTDAERGQGEARKSSASTCEMQVQTSPRIESVQNHDQLRAAEGLRSPNRHFPSVVNISPEVEPEIDSPTSDVVFTFSEPILVSPTKYRRSVCTGLVSTDEEHHVEDDASSRGDTDVDPIDEKLHDDASETSQQRDVTVADTDATSSAVEQDIHDTRGEQCNEACPAGMSDASKRLEEKCGGDELCEEVTLAEDQVVESCQVGVAGSLVVPVSRSDDQGGCEDSVAREQVAMSEMKSSAGDEAQVEEVGFDNMNQTGDACETESSTIPNQDVSSIVSTECVGKVERRTAAVMGEGPECDIDSEPAAGSSCQPTADDEVPCGAKLDQPESHTELISSNSVVLDSPVIVDQLGVNSTDAGDSEELAARMTGSENQVAVNVETVVEVGNTDCDDRDGPMYSDKLCLDGSEVERIPVGADTNQVCAPSMCEIEDSCSVSGDNEHGELMKSEETHVPIPESADMMQAADETLQTSVCSAPTEVCSDSLHTTVGLNHELASSNKSMVVTSESSPLEVGEDVQATCAPQNADLACGMNIEASISVDSVTPDGHDLQRDTLNPPDHSHSTAVLNADAKDRMSEAGVAQVQDKLESVCEGSNVKSSTSETLYAVEQQLCTPESLHSASNSESSMSLHQSISDHVSEPSLSQGTNITIGSGCDSRHPSDETCTGVCHSQELEDSFHSDMTVGNAELTSDHPAPSHAHDDSIDTDIDMSEEPITSQNVDSFETDVLNHSASDIVTSDDTVVGSVHPDMDKHDEMSDGTVIITDTEDDAVEKPKVSMAVAQHLIPNDDADTDGSAVLSESEYDLDSDEENEKKPRKIPVLSRRTQSSPFKKRCLVYQSTPTNANKIARVGKRSLNIGRPSLGNSKLTVVEEADDSSVCLSDDQYDSDLDRSGDEIRGDEAVVQKTARSELSGACHSTPLQTYTSEGFTCSETQAATHSGVTGIENANGQIPAGPSATKNGQGQVLLDKSNDASAYLSDCDYDGDSDEERVDENGKRGKIRKQTGDFPCSTDEIPQKKSEVPVTTSESSRKEKSENVVAAARSKTEAGISSKIDLGGTPALKDDNSVCLSDSEYDADPLDEPRPDSQVFRCEKPKAEQDKCITNEAPERTEKSVEADIEMDEAQTAPAGMTQSHGGQSGSQEDLCRTEESVEADIEMNEAQTTAAGTTKSYGGQPESQEEEDLCLFLPPTQMTQVDIPESEVEKLPVHGGSDCASAHSCDIHDSESEVSEKINPKSNDVDEKAAVTQLEQMSSVEMDMSESAEGTSAEPGPISSKEEELIDGAVSYSEVEVTQSVHLIHESTQLEPDTNLVVPHESEGLEENAEGVSSVCVSSNDDAKDVSSSVGVRTFTTASNEVAQDIVEHLLDGVMEAVEDILHTTREAAVSGFTDTVQEIEMSSEAMTMIVSDAADETSEDVAKSEVVPSDTGLVPESEVDVPSETNRDDAPEVYVPSETSRDDASKVDVPSDTGLVAASEVDVPSDTGLVATSEVDVPSERSLVVASEVDVQSETSRDDASKVDVPSDTGLVAASEFDVPSDTGLVATSEIEVPSDTGLVAASEFDVPSDTGLVATSEIEVPSDAGLVAASEVDVPSETGLVATSEVDVPSETRLVATSEVDVPSDTGLVATSEIEVPSDTGLVATSEIEVPPDTGLVAASEVDVPSDTSLVAASEFDVPSDTGLVATSEIDVPSEAGLVAASEVDVPSETGMVATSEVDLPSETGLVATSEVDVPSETSLVATSEVDVPFHTGLVAASHVPSETSLVVASEVDVSSDTGLVATSEVDVLSDTGLVATSEVDVPSETGLVATSEIEVPSETGLVATSEVDVPSETGLVATSEVDVPSETSLVATSEVDVPSDTGLVATSEVDVPSETSLVATSEVDVPSETGLVATSEVDVPSETGLVATSEVDVPSETGLVATSEVDVPSETSLVATSEVDVPFDTGLVAASHVPSETSLVVASEVDVPSDTRLVATSEVDVLSDTGLVATSEVDVPSDPGLIATSEVDVLSDTGLVATSEIDVPSETSLVATSEVDVPPETGLVAASHVPSDTGLVDVPSDTGLVATSEVDVPSETGLVTASEVDIPSETSRDDEDDLQKVNLSGVAPSSVEEPSPDVRGPMELADHLQKVEDEPVPSEANEESQVAIFEASCQSEVNAQATPLEAGIESEVVAVAQLEGNECPGLTGEQVAMSEVIQPMQDIRDEENQSVVVGPSLEPSKCLMTSSEMNEIQAVTSDDAVQAVTEVQVAPSASEEKGKDAVPMLEVIPSSEKDVTLDLSGVESALDVEEGHVAPDAGGDLDMNGDEVGTSQELNHGEVTPSAGMDEGQVLPPDQSEMSRDQEAPSEKNELHMTTSEKATESQPPPGQSKGMKEYQAAPSAVVSEEVTGQVKAFEAVSKETCEGQVVTSEVPSSEKGEGQVATSESHSEEMSEGQVRASESPSEKTSEGQIASSESPPEMASGSQGAALEGPSKVTSECQGFPAGETGEGQVAASGSSEASTCDSDIAKSESPSEERSQGQFGLSKTSEELSESQVSTLEIPSEKVKEGQEGDYSTSCESVAGSCSVALNTVKGSVSDDKEAECMRHSKDQQQGSVSGIVAQDIEPAPQAGEDEEALSSVGGSHETAEEVECEKTGDLLSAHPDRQNELTASCDDKKPFERTNIPLASTSELAGDVKNDVESCISLSDGTVTVAADEDIQSSLPVSGGLEESCASENAVEQAGSGPVVTVESPHSSAEKCIDHCQKRPRSPSSDLGSSQDCKRKKTDELSGPCSTEESLSLRDDDNESESFQLFLEPSQAVQEENVEAEETCGDEKPGDHGGDVMEHIDESCDSSSKIKSDMTDTCGDASTSCNGNLQSSAVALENLGQGTENVTPLHEQEKSAEAPAPAEVPAGSVCPADMKDEKNHSGGAESDLSFVDGSNVEKKIDALVSEHSQAPSDFDQSAFCQVQTDAECAEKKADATPLPTGKAESDHRGQRAGVHDKQPPKLDSSRSSESSAGGQFDDADSDEDETVLLASQLSWKPTRAGRSPRGQPRRPPPKHVYNSPRSASPTPQFVSQLPHHRRNLTAAQKEVISPGGVRRSSLPSRAKPVAVGQPHIRMNTPPPVPILASSTAECSQSRKRKVSSSEENLDESKRTRAENGDSVCPGQKIESEVDASSDDKVIDSSTSGSIFQRGFVPAPSNSDKMSVSKSDSVKTELLADPPTCDRAAVSVSDSVVAEAAPDASSCDKVSVSEVNNIATAVVPDPLCDETSVPKTDSIVTQSVPDPHRCDSVSVSESNSGPTELVPILDVPGCDKMTVSETDGVMTESAPDPTTCVEESVSETVATELEPGPSKCDEMSVSETDHVLKESVSAAPTCYSTSETTSDAAVAESVSDRPICDETSVPTDVSSKAVPDVEDVAVTVDSNLSKNELMTGQDEIGVTKEGNFKRPLSPNPESDDCPSSKRSKMHKDSKSSDDSEDSSGLLLFLEPSQTANEVESDDMLEEDVEAPQAIKAGPVEDVGTVAISSEESKGSERVTVAQKSSSSQGFVVGENSDDTVVEMAHVADAGEGIESSGCEDGVDMDIKTSTADDMKCHRKEDGMTDGPAEVGDLNGMKSGDKGLEIPGVEIPRLVNDHTPAADHSHVSPPPDVAGPVADCPAVTASSERDELDVTGRSASCDTQARVPEPEMGRIESKEEVITKPGLPCTEPNRKDVIPRPDVSESVDLFASDGEQDGNESSDEMCLYLESTQQEEAPSGDPAAANTDSSQPSKVDSRQVESSGSCGTAASHDGLEDTRGVVADGSTISDEKCTTMVTPCGPSVEAMSDSLGHIEGAKLVEESANDGGDGAAKTSMSADAIGATVSERATEHEEAQHILSSTKEVSQRSEMAVSEVISISSESSSTSADHVVPPVASSSPAPIFLSSGDEIDDNRSLSREDAVVKEERDSNLDDASSKKEEQPAGCTQTAADRDQRSRSATPPIDCSSVKDDSFVECSQDEHEDDDSGNMSPILPVTYSVLDNRTNHSRIPSPHAPSITAEFSDDEDDDFTSPVINMDCLMSQKDNMDDAEQVSATDHHQSPPAKTVDDDASDDDAGCHGDLPPQATSSSRKRPREVDSEDNIDDIHDQDDCSQVIPVSENISHKRVKYLVNTASLTSDDEIPPTMNDSDSEENDCDNFLGKDSSRAQTSGGGLAHDSDDLRSSDEEEMEVSRPPPRRKDAYKSRSDLSGVSDVKGGFKRPLSGTGGKARPGASRSLVSAVVAEGSESLFSSQSLEGCSQPASSQSRLSSILERIIHKKRIKQEPEPSQADDSTDGAAAPDASVPPVAPAISYIHRAGAILSELKGKLRQSPAWKENRKIKDWMRDLSSLQQRACLPRTVIAVVGDTGVGKSCLMNALLDHANILPTSGMNACTSVIVEVGSNDRDDIYEAKIEFLAKEEWNQELQLLWEDIHSHDGEGHKSDFVAGARSKIRAVYGEWKKAKSLEKLMQNDTITRHLGTVKTIKTRNAEDMRVRVEQYVRAKPHNVPDQFWPIVKKVQLRIPKCDVCSSGAVLVDLPGTRDANAARDNVAKEYLKTSTVVWVVANITRAIDSKTAKELLGEQFRRQLLLDGQFSNLSFICTKTDEIRNDEIIRDLKMQSKVDEQENLKTDLSRKKLGLEDALCSVEEQLKISKKQLTELTQDINEDEGNLNELKTLIEEEQDSMEAESEEAQQSHLTQQSLQESVALQYQQRDELEALIKQLKSEHRQKTTEVEDITKRIEEIQRAIRLKCIIARNQHSQGRIQEDFQEGIKEMMHRASSSTGEITPVNPSRHKLNVFCVSSVGYLFIKRLLLDGARSVFNHEDETGIPPLRQHVHQVTATRNLSAARRLIGRLNLLISNILGYLQHEESLSGKTQSEVEAAMLAAFDSLHSSHMDALLDYTREQMVKLVTEHLQPPLKTGVLRARDVANTTVSKWSAPERSEICVSKNSRPEKCIQPETQDGQEEETQAKEGKEKQQQTMSQPLLKAPLTSPKTSGHLHITHKHASRSRDSFGNVCLEKPPELEPVVNELEPVVKIPQKVHQQGPGENVPHRHQYPAHQQSQECTQQTDQQVQTSRPCKAVDPKKEVVQFQSQSSVEQSVTPSVSSNTAVKYVAGQRYRLHYSNGVTIGAIFDGELFKIESAPPEMPRQQETKYEIGQEYQLHYSNGVRINAIYDGNFFKLKHTAEMQSVSLPVGKGQTQTPLQHLEAKSTKDEMHTAAIQMPRMLPQSRPSVQTNQLLQTSSQGLPVRQSTTHSPAKKEGFVIGQEYKLTYSSGQTFTAVFDGINFKSKSVVQEKSQVSNMPVRSQASLRSTGKQSTQQQKTQQHQPTTLLPLREQVQSRTSLLLQQQKQKIPQDKPQLHQRWQKAKQMQLSQEQQDPLSEKQSKALSPLTPSKQQRKNISSSLQQQTSAHLQQCQVSQPQASTLPGQVQPLPVTPQLSRIPQAQLKRQSPQKELQQPSQMQLFGLSRMQTTQRFQHAQQSQMFPHRHQSQHAQQPQHSLLKPPLPPMTRLLQQPSSSQQLPVPQRFSQIQQSVRRSQHPKVPQSHLYHSGTKR